MVEVALRTMEVYAETKRINIYSFCFISSAARKKVERMNQKTKWITHKSNAMQSKGKPHVTETACIVFGGRWNESSIVIWGC